ncbi:extracellular solute-binding protein [Roseicitreum antarcticum]|uniref:Iron(III) transport system substrate-binding protein n=1 Tax=Roseicitreum antarcticum TaxID=564137 RepID=A0A1H2RFJ3_9RHOB|nr:extracellular solute-binding protein [Roseicitreum antarcticum]SDW18151.1 iron(III) transport system substrate-binding protein [Roseicitreum antarcticum]
MTVLRTSVLALSTLAATPLAADVTLYSGRGETLVAPIIAAFTADTGIEVNVRYAGTAELAILLQEEGDASPADVYWAQDVAALGAVKGQFADLPAETLEKVDAVYRDADGKWIGTSGRARVVAYSPERLSAEELPATMTDMTDPMYKGRIALPPTNGSFVAHVAALRVATSDEAALEWLQGIAANEPIIVRNNTAAYQAIADGEADIAMTNNYYLGRFLAADAEFPVAQTSFSEAGDIGNLMMPAGVGVLESSDNKEESIAFINYLLSDGAQQYFTGNVYEYPVTGVGIVPVAGMGQSFSDAVAAAPEFDVNSLTDLEGTIALIREAGLL